MYTKLYTLFFSGTCDLFLHKVELKTVKMLSNSFFPFSPFKLSINMSLCKYKIKKYKKGITFKTHVQTNITFHKSLFS